MQKIKGGEDQNILPLVSSMPRDQVGKGFSLQNRKLKSKRHHIATGT